MSINNIVIFRLIGNPQLSLHFPISYHCQMDKTDVEFFVIIRKISDWWFGTFLFFLYWEYRSQLTFICFRGVGQPPTR